MAESIKEQFRIKVESVKKHSFFGWESIVARRVEEKKRKGGFMGDTCLYSIARSMLCEAVAHHPDG